MTSTGTTYTAVPMASDRAAQMVEDFHAMVKSVNMMAVRHNATGGEFSKDEEWFTAYIRVRGIAQKYD